VREGHQSIQGCFVFSNTGCKNKDCHYVVVSDY
jgi:hypothetical protein